MASWRAWTMGFLVGVGAARFPFAPCVFNLLVADPYPPTETSAFMLRSAPLRAH